MYADDFVGRKSPPSSYEPESLYRPKGQEFSIDKLMSWVFSIGEKIGEKLVFIKVPESSHRPVLGQEDPIDELEGKEVGPDPRIVYKLIGRLGSISDDRNCL